MAARSAIFDGVDPRLVQLVQQVLESYGPYGGRVTSGYRQGSVGYHGEGRGRRALDVELFDRETGAALENYQDPKNFQAYQQLANAIYAKADPELQKMLRWGGYFSGGKDKYGALDLMHFDLGGLETPMGGGSWNTGLNPEQAKLWGLNTGGGADPNASAYAQRAAASYTPEQRRNAIAAIESAGSGDYGALGTWLGGPDERDRAYGKYQIMGKNIPVWSQQVLGRAVTPEEFLRDPKIQDTIFDKIFGDYVAKYGEKGAAEAWFGGPGAVGKEARKDIHGTTVAGYGDRYMQGLDAAWKGSGGPAASGAGSAGGGAVAGTTAPATAATDDKDKDGFSLGEAFENLGQGMTGAGGSGRVPNVQVAKPMTTALPGMPGQIVNPDAMMMQRQKLAEAMNRLNAGKLWV